jgi:hypothetical protein
MQQSMDFGIETETTRKFREFHAKNPQVYKTLVRLAREAKAKGKSKISIELLINRMRWEMWINADDPNQKEFKFSNDYKPFYARLIMEDNPELAGIFNIKTMWKNG